MMGSTEGTISSNIVVYAVNAWIPTLLPRFAKIVEPLKGQVLITSPIRYPLLKDDKAAGIGFIREDEKDEEEEDIFYLMRRKKDHKVVAGTRVPKKTAETLEQLYDDGSADPSVTETLVQFLKDSFPSMRVGKDNEEDTWRVEYNWQGIMGFTDDGNPLIGPLPEEQERERDEIEAGMVGEYVVGAFNGDGMTKCFAAGKAIAEMISGKLHPNQFIQSFLPGRYLKK